jgi:catechol 2,3-dioxygenase-like lactoylglutathione lyase family enzyme
MAPAARSIRANSNCDAPSRLDGRVYPASQMPLLSRKEERLCSNRPRHMPAFSWYLIPRGKDRDAEETMRVRRVDHVLLAMPPGRESEARNFYQGILGIPEAVKPNDLAARGGCWFEDGELKIHLGVEKNFAPARKAHPALLVENLAALTATLVKAGVPISHDQPLEGYDRIFVHDPFGNRIELMEPKASQA